jgi:CRP/FNR family transcriptional regulator, cyclic AMP receptor protein
MADRDFFSFCTSLKPVELKAMGELSDVVHLDEGEVVYSANDPADALYIINRGVVELVPDPALRGTASTYLSRGDIFGDCEALSDSPRTHMMRAREKVSLQRIRSSDFTELAKRVPSFFRYLSEQLAGRLLQKYRASLSKSHCIELSGNLSNFDLVTIYQTIVSSMQTGELSVLDESRQRVATFFFERGRPHSGQFQHLTGEEAFWQLFLSESLAGTFSFSSHDQPLGQCVQGTEMKREAGDLLICALRNRDEFQALKPNYPDRSMKLVRQKLNFAWPGKPDSELQSVAEQIWQLAYTTPLSLSSLYQKCSVCEFKILEVIDQLVKAELFRLVPADETQPTEELVIEFVNA